VSDYTTITYLPINSCYGSDALSSGGTFADLERGRLSLREVFICPSKAIFRSYSWFSEQRLDIIYINKNSHDRHPDSKMPRKGRKAAKLWSLHPKLHDDVAQLLDEEGLQIGFLDADDEETNIQYWDTNVMGRFICPNSGCYSSGWSSKKVAITIRMYPQQRYNARVYHQRCRNCKAVGRLVLDTGSYVERVTYWLKKWNGIEVQPPNFSGQSRGPHDSELCEGCKVDHCSNLNQDLALVLAR
jgi:hypothetical protein